MNTLSHIPAYVWRLLFAAALVAVALLTQAVAADCECVDYLATAQPESWIFARSRYSHDPDTGARVAQYSQVAPVEPLPDPRDVTSGYSRTRTVLRGADGSTDTYYRVRNYGNGRGGLDAEWEPLLRRLGQTSAVRASLGVFNDRGDVERLVAGIAEVQRVFGGAGR